jgi:hypothetical protein
VARIELGPEPNTQGGASQSRSQPAGDWHRAALAHPNACWKTSGAFGGAVCAPRGRSCRSRSQSGSLALQGRPGLHPSFRSFSNALHPQPAFRPGLRLLDAVHARHVLKPRLAPRQRHAAGPTPPGSEGDEVDAAARVVTGPPVPALALAPAEWRGYRHRRLRSCLSGLCRDRRGLLVGCAASCRAARTAARLITLLIRCSPGCGAGVVRHFVGRSVRTKVRTIFGFSRPYTFDYPQRFVSDPPQCALGVNSFL